MDFVFMERWMCYLHATPQHATQHAVYIYLPLPPSRLRTHACRRTRRLLFPSSATQRLNTALPHRGFQWVVKGVATPSSLRWNPHEQSSRAGVLWGFLRGLDIDAE
jgi:predicted DCC family thiol-disulfide oxidoreductase YuxK